MSLPFYLITLTRAMGLMAGWCSRCGLDLGHRVMPLYKLPMTVNPVHTPTNGCNLPRLIVTAGAAPFHGYLLPIVLSGSLFHQMILVTSHRIPVPNEFRRSLRDGELDPQSDDWVGDEITATFLADEIEVSKAL